MLVFEQLPDSNPIKKVAATYITAYEAKYGKGSRTTFGGQGNTGGQTMETDEAIKGQRKRSEMQPAPGMKMIMNNVATAPSANAIGMPRNIANKVAPP